MSARQRLAESFARFENHAFPGYPDSPGLQEAYEELVERGGRLVAAIQRLLAGEPVDAAQVPAFGVPVPEGTDPASAELRGYRQEVDRLRALLLEACREP